jgi:hypothetical protein
VETGDARERVVVGNLNAASEQSAAQLVEVSDNKSGMSFPGGVKLPFDADVELLRAALEPAAATGAERLGLFNFGQAEERAIKFASGGFATLRSGDLQVIEMGDVSFHRQYKIPVRGRFCAGKELGCGRGQKSLKKNRLLDALTPHG